MVARVLWWRLRGSLWFVPALLVAGAAGLAVGLVELGAAYDVPLEVHWPRIFGVGAEGSRSLLSAIATAMLTVAGTTFSVTLAVLSLAASQYSPRVLHTFMSDRPTQFVLGFFVAAFAYCLLVLRTIQSGPDGFVPSLAVLGGIVLAFIAVGLLVFFIHHLATSIQASMILARVAGATGEAIETLFPDEIGESVDESAQDGLGHAGTWTAVPAAGTGYIVSVDGDGLLAFAREARRVVRMDLAVGDFAIAGQPIASLQGGAPAGDEACRRLNGCYSFDRQRTIEQDAAFGIQQIVDIGLRALSPGINDQSTAILCIDRLSELLVRLARRRIETPCRRDGDVLRVIARGPTFAGLARLAFRDLRENGADKPAVAERLLLALERVRRETTNRYRQAVLAEEAQRIRDAASGR